MIGVALKGLLGRKLRAVLTALRDRPRRRDDQRQLRPHRHAREDVRRHLRRVVREHRRGDQLKEAIEHGRRHRGCAGLPGGDPREVEALPGVASAQGSIEDEARLVDTDGEPIGGADDGIAIAVDPAADQSLNPLSSSPASGRAATARSRSTSRPPTTGLRRREDRRRVRRRPGAAVTRSAGSSASARSTRSAARRSASSTCRRPSALFDKRGRLDLIRVAAEEGCPSAELIGQIRPLLSATRR